MMRDLMQDIRYAARVLWRSPGFTAVAILTLAVGIGANTAVFSVVNTLLLQPLPFEDHDRIVMLWERNTELGVDKEQAAYGDFTDWKEKNTTFESLGCVVSHTTVSRNFLLQTGDDTTRLRGRHVSSDLFKVLRVKPLIGDVLTESDDQPGGLKRAVLSYSFWNQVFGGDPNVIGRTLDLNRSEPFEVIGVMPPEFRFPQDAEVWLSIAGFRDERWLQRVLPSHGHHGLWAFGRLTDGVTVEQAQADLNTIQQQIYGDPENQDSARVASEVVVVPLLDQVNGSETGPALLFLLGAVAFVLLIACANVANLLLARSLSRRREFAIRAALGAGRFRVIRQLLTESLMLSLLGAAVAVVVAIGGMQLLELIRTDSTFLGVKEFRFDRFGEVNLDLRVLGFTVLVAVLTGTLFGLMPALQASRLNVSETMKEDSRSGTAGKGTRFFQNALLVGEVSLALVLLAGAGMAIRSFARMLAIDPGVDAQQVLRAELDLDVARQVYGMDDYSAHDEVLERLRALPGVESVSSCGEIPVIKSGWKDTFQIVGPEHDGFDRANLPSTDVRLYSPGMFETLGIPLLAGRDFADTDNRQNPDVAIVNQAFAEKYFPGSNPIGRKVRERGFEEWEREIVGVVGNVRNYSADSSNQDEFYRPFNQAFMAGAEVGPIILIRTSSDPAELIPAIRHAVGGSERGQQVLIQFRRLQAVLDISASQERFQTVLLSIFSGIALLLAVVGVYGVMSYSTAQRTQEIGIRLALGAQPNQILKSVVGRGALLCMLGIAIGACASVVVGQVLSRFVYGVEAIDGPTLATVAICLLLISTIASFIPAYRAMRTDPAIALRSE